MQVLSLDTQQQSCNTEVVATAANGREKHIRRHLVSPNLWIFLMFNRHPQKPAQCFVWHSQRVAFSCANSIFHMGLPCGIAADMKQKCSCCSRASDTCDACETHSLALMLAHVSSERSNVKLHVNRFVVVTLNCWSMRQRPPCCVFLLCWIFASSLVFVSIIVALIWEWRSSFFQISLRGSTIHRKRLIARL